MKTRRNVGFSVYKPPNSAFWYAQWMDTVSGKRIRRSTKTTIKPKAMELASKWSNQSWERKNLGAAVNWTVDYLLEWTWDTFWRDRPYNKLMGDAAKKAKFQVLSAFIKKFGNLPACELTPEALSEYRHEREKIVRHSTTNREFSHVSFAFARAIQRKKLFENPFLEFKRVSEKSLRRDRTATPEEEKLIVSEPGSTLIKACRFALATGLRQGEIRNLRSVHVDLLNKEMTVSSWKGSYNVRYVPLTPEAIKILSTMDLTKEFVFSGPKGRQIPKNGLLHSGWQRLIKKLKIENLTFHDLRHTFATRYWRKTRDIATLSDILGHQKLDTTMVYINVKRTDLSKKPKLGLNFVTPDFTESENNSKNVENQLKGL